MNDVPTAWDWVEARSKCSVRGMFLQLVERIGSDAKRVNELNASGLRAEVTLPSEDKVITVMYSDRMAVDGVVVECLEDVIHVKRSGSRGATLFTARPTIQRTGRCLFEVEGVHLELWQVAERALSALFFDR